MGERRATRTMKKEIWSMSSKGTVTSLSGEKKVLEI